MELIFTDIQTILENDANAACAAECWVGTGKGKQNMVMISSISFILS